MRLGRNDESAADTTRIHLVNSLLSVKIKNLFEIEKRACLKLCEKFANIWRKWTKNTQFFDCVECGHTMREDERGLPLVSAQS
jgi:hypothetical protein